MMKKIETYQETWKPIVLGCLFAFFGLSNLALVLSGEKTLYGTDLGEVGTLLIFGFAFLFFGVSWGFLKRKYWARSWGYWTGALNLIGGLSSSNTLLMGISVFMLVLTYLSRNELVRV